MRERSRARERRERARVVTASERERERSRVREIERPRARAQEREREREREVHSPFPGVMLYRTEIEFKEREGARERDRERDLISVCDLSLVISPCPLKHAVCTPSYTYHIAVITDPPPPIPCSFLPQNIVMMSDRCRHCAVAPSVHLIHRFYCEQSFPLLFRSPPPPPPIRRGTLIHLQQIRQGRLL